MADAFCERTTSLSQEKCDERAMHSCIYSTHLVIINHLLHETSIPQQRLSRGPVGASVEQDAYGFHDRADQLWRLAEHSDLSYVILVQ